MNLFSPYKVQSSSNGELHIAETPARRAFLFFFFRIFPFILLFLGWKVTSIPDLPDGLKYAIGALMLLITVLLLFKTYTIEVKISRRFIELTLQRFFTVKSVTIISNDIEKIIVKEVHGRGGGYFYKLKMNDGSKNPFFTIPALYMKTGKLQQINDRLHSITMLEVEQI